MRKSGASVFPLSRPSLDALCVRLGCRPCITKNKNGMDCLRILPFDSVTGIN